VNALASLGMRPASIQQAVWAIAALHRAAALPDPSRAEVVRLALKRMARALSTRQRQAAPLGKIEVASWLRLEQTSLPCVMSPCS
jgi:RuvA, C-terminal domain